MAQGRPLYYTERSSSSNPRDPLHDEPYAAAFAIKTCLEAARLVEDHSDWTFSDIFEENYFPSVPFHGGFGLLNLYSIAKPVYRAYQLVRGLGNKQLPVDGTHAMVDTWITRDDDEIGVLCTDRGLRRHLTVSEQIRIFLNRAPRPVAAVLIQLKQRGDRSSDRRQHEFSPSGIPR